MQSFSFNSNHSVYRGKKHVIPDLVDNRAQYSSERAGLVNGSAWTRGGKGLE